MRRVPTEIDRFFKIKISLTRSRRYHTRLIHRTSLAKKVIFLSDHTYFKPDEKKQQIFRSVVSLFQQSPALVWLK